MEVIYFEVDRIGDLFITRFLTKKHIKYTPDIKRVLKFGISTILCNRVINEHKNGISSEILSCKYQIPKAMVCTILYAKRLQ